MIPVTLESRATFGGAGPRVARPGLQTHRVGRSEERSDEVRQLQLSFYFFIGADDSNVDAGRCSDPFRASFPSVDSAACKSASNF